MWRLQEIGLSTDNEVLHSRMDLPSLLQLVETEGQAWGVFEKWSNFRDAFALALQLAGSRHTSPSQEHLPQLRAVVSALAAALSPHVDKLPDAELAVLPLWALARASVWPPELVEPLIARLARDGGELLHTASAKHLALLWWSLAVPDAPPVPTAAIAPLAFAASRMLRLGPTQLSPTDVTQTLLSVARLAPQPQLAPLVSRLGDLLHHLTACLLDPSQLPHAAPEAFADSLYALSQLRGVHGFMAREELLRPLVAALGRAAAGAGAAGGPATAQGLTPQRLANVLHALADIQCCTDAVPPYGLDTLTEVLRELRLQVRGAPAVFSPTQVGKVLSALVKLPVATGPAREHAAAVAIELAAEAEARAFAGFDAPTLSITVWALARLGHTEERWFGAAVAAAAEPSMLAAASGRDLTSLWLGLARARQPAAARRLLAAMLGDGGGSSGEDGAGGEGGVGGEAAAASAATATALRAASALSCSNLLWAMAKLDVSDHRLVDLLAGRLAAALPLQHDRAHRVLPVMALWALGSIRDGAMRRNRGLVEGLVAEVEARRAAAARAGRSDAYDEGECTQLKRAAYIMRRDLGARGES
ncbi:hypothetical protein GPECTOR_16g699 [Gonium pectorale]|uniref:Uncharacterized protein n=1 Tax=Gonium pectorale TaxID=33097 RepID=A0A150GL53_GONPE|nr:hypothetical protein GPECTOR_16g699 [Gonium pectorale]|eukprot:KXZ50524.1 hypothetical protein GPECTOR_16g699 [Gonium pectorale]